MKLVLMLQLIILLIAATYVNAESCNSPLLGSATLTATSEIDQDRGADKARLHGGAAWTAKVSDFSQYLTIELPEQYAITAIATQGRPFSSAFVENYRIEFGDEAGSYAEYKDREGNIRLFEGNSDGSTVQRNTFDIPIIARWIRINPTRWRDRISMRVELYGCRYVAHTRNFDGKNYVVKDLKRHPVVSQKDRIRYRFRTNHANGVILYSRGTQGDIFALQLIENQLLLNIDLGGEGVLTSLSVGSLLDDNLWHDVSIVRNKTEISLTIDRVVIRERIRGDFSSLDLNREIFIGGIPNFNQEGLMVSQNFTGCMENLYINDTNIFEEIDRDYYTYTKIADLATVCSYRDTKPVHFKTSNSYLKFVGLQTLKLNCSFDFRTFDSDGTMLYNQFITGGFVRLYLEKGLIKIELESEDTPKAPIEPFDYQLNDGKWHATMLILDRDRIELHIDGKPSITTRRFSMKTGINYLIGGGVYGTSGFVGCMRSIAISGDRPSSSVQKVTSSPGEILMDACQMVDRCNPNPCEHGGSCNQNSEEFFCDCELTGYAGAVCHAAKHPLSCEAYRLDNPRTRRVDIQIDVDGSGPLEPFPVTCEMPFDSQTTTTLHHKNEHTTEVKGFSKPGSFIQDIIYNTDMEQIVELVNRSYSCSQSIQYDCLNSRLFNSPVAAREQFEPFSWWVSRNNQKMDYWGGSLPGTRKCSCGLYGTCADRSKWCNCDADSFKWETDKGEITQKEYLPVRQLRFGDTGSTMDDKKGRYTLGPLICKGDSLFDNVISFRYEDATIDLPPFDMGHSADIYFQFKTTAKNGVFIHSKGPVDFIKILLFEEDSIQFQYHAGNGPLGAAANAPYKLNDNNWHSILFERNRKEARLVIDGDIIAEAKERAGPIRALHLTSSLVIGATVSYEEGFVGCIRAFMLNGEVVDLLRMAEQGLYGVSPGCVGKCASNPCQNNGTCLEGYSSYECDCQWTAFKGPICADEIGANLRSEYYIRYDFETTISTLEENIRVAFVTTEKTGMIFGVSSATGEYLNLMMSTSGHLRLVFDFGFERQEIIIKNENFALGQIHDIKIRRVDRGSKLFIFVDNYEPLVHTFKIDSKADAQFNKLKSIYIGRNESMGTGDGFTGCISRAQFDDHFPLRRYFQEARRENVRSHPKVIREDNCGIEPVTYPPEVSETRPPPTYPPGISLEHLKPAVDDSAILGGVLVIILLALILMGILIGRYMSRHKGEYRTHEDTGAKDAPDADAAVVQGKTGHGVPKRKEWFI